MVPVRYSPCDTQQDDIVNLNHVPTTIFTPLEYGSIGFSEEKAIETFGEDNIEVFHAEFTPLEFALPNRKSRCYAKLIVNYLDRERIIGFHYMGPNAGEVTQVSDSVSARQLC